MWINVSVDGPASQLVAHRTNQRAGSLLLGLPHGVGPLAHLIAGFLGALDSCLLNEQSPTGGMNVIEKLLTVHKNLGNQLNN